MGPSLQGLRVGDQPAPRQIRMPKVPLSLPRLRCICAQRQSLGRASLRKLQLTALGVVDENCALIKFPRYYQNPAFRSTKVIQQILYCRRVRQSMSGCTVRLWPGRANSANHIWAVILVLGVLAYWRYLPARPNGLAKVAP